MVTPVRKACKARFLPPPPLPSSPCLLPLKSQAPAAISGQLVLVPLEAVPCASPASVPAGEQQGPGSHPSAQEPFLAGAEP